MSIDNPQREIAGDLAWRVNRSAGVPVIEPFFGQPREGDIAVTRGSVWVAVGDKWRREENEWATYLVAMLRFWLAAHEGWKNEKKLLTNRNGDLVAALDDAIEFMKTVRLHSRDHAAKMPNLDAEIVRLTEIAEEGDR